MESLSNVFARLATAEWMADTGIPLFATLTGLFIAYLFVRQQFKNDRRLRRADHRLAAARRLGEVLMRVSPTGQWELFQSAFERDAFWGDHETVVLAVSEASILLPREDLVDISALAETTEALWAVCYRRGMDANTNRRSHAFACGQMFGKYGKAMAAYGESLLGWDGLGKLPRPQTGLAKIPARGERQQWYAQEEHRYDLLVTHAIKHGHSCAALLRPSADEESETAPLSAGAAPMASTEATRASDARDLNALTYSLRVELGE